MVTDQQAKTLMSLIRREKSLARAVLVRRIQFVLRRFDTTRHRQFFQWVATLADSVQKVHLTQILQARFASISQTGERRWSRVLS